MAHADVASAKVQKRIEWMWRSNSEPWHCSTETDQWSSYSDIESAVIEEAFANKLSVALLDDYHIDFQQFVQISNNNLNNQRQVKRVALEKGEGTRVRKERFMPPDPITPSRPFRPMEGHIMVRRASFTGAAESYYNVRWNNLDAFRLYGYMLVEKAAEGLIIEGKKAGKEREAQYMAQQLLMVKEGTPQEIFAVCAHLYSKASFLYRKLNEIMRLDCDIVHSQFVQSKVPTFGPFAILLSEMKQTTFDKITVYRGCTLSEDLIVQFKPSSGDECHVFSAFTSTSRNKEVAKMFGGNVLFIIECENGGIDVSPYSLFPDEEEVLLSPNFWFHVQSCQFCLKQKKWIIHLQYYDDTERAGADP